MRWHFFGSGRRKLGSLLLTLSIAALVFAVYLPEVATADPSPGQGSQANAVANGNANANQNHTDTDSNANNNGNHYGSTASSDNGNSDHSGNPQAQGSSGQSDKAGNGGNSDHTNQGNSGNGGNSGKSGDTVGSQSGGNSGKSGDSGNPGSSGSQPPNAGNGGTSNTGNAGNGNSASSTPTGNFGTIKVEIGPIAPTRPGPDNDPWVTACSFTINGFSQNADVQSLLFTAWPPTRSTTPPHTSDRNITNKTSVHPPPPNGVDWSVFIDQTTNPILQSSDYTFTHGPDPSLGPYAHVKVEAMNGPDGTGTSLKSKVFWVPLCAPTNTPTSTATPKTPTGPTHTPTATPTKTPTAPTNTPTSTATPKSPTGPTNTPTPTNTTGPVGPSGATNTPTSTPTSAPSQGGAAPTSTATSPAAVVAGAAATARPTAVLGVSVQRLPTTGGIPVSGRDVAVVGAALVGLGYAIRRRF